MATNIGKKWYNNGEINKMFIPGTEPSNFTLGKLQKLSTNTLSGRHAYTDGKKTIFIKDNEEIPDGFYKGVSNKQKEHLISISRNQKGIPKSEETKIKISERAKERFKDPTNHPLYGKHHSEETRQKIKEANKGKPSPFKGVKYTEEQKLLKDNKITQKYGSLNSFYTERQKKCKETKLSRYGDANYNNREKALNTISELPNFYESKALKSKETKIKKYGSLQLASEARINTIVSNSNYSTREEYFNNWRNSIYKNQKHSKLEDRVQAFLDTNCIEYKRSFLIANQNYKHEFDFAIFINSILTILIDCDGLYYHGYTSDENGKSVNTYVDDYRSLLVPDKVKFLIILEGQDNEEEGLNCLLKWLSAPYEEYLEEVFNWCRESDFPFPSYSEKVLNNSYKALMQSDCNKFSIKARYGEKIVKHFHPSIYFAHKKGKKSPCQAWESDYLLKQCISNRILYKGNNLDRSKVLAGFTISGIAPKVSIFNPYLAKYLINKYLKDEREIFDPFCGYSGRLLGAASLNKTYIGQDINEITIDEALDLINYFNFNNCSVSYNDAITSYGNYESLFTCPPYSDKEFWKLNDDLTIHSCDEWIDICLSNFKCNKYLFVVDNTFKYKNYIVEEIHNNSHLGSNTEYIILITANNNVQ